MPAVIGTFGNIDFTTLGPERVLRARTRIRDFEGQVRRVEATAPSKKLAEHYALREVTIGRIEPFLTSLGTNRSYSYVFQFSRLSGGPRGAPAGAAVTSPR